MWKAEDIRDFFILLDLDSEEKRLKVSFDNILPKEKDAVLSLHHACMHTMSATPAFKIIENHIGKAFIQLAAPVMVQSIS